ncbi:hypothetical protein [Janthinobacterium sp. LB3P118]|uniref:hypothetical protein n=1 Tax=Janthinobacterium sp. LB3P118 TaxID=3424195 RepID=UPI003F29BBB9
MYSLLSAPGRNSSSAGGLAWADALERLPLAWTYLPSLNARIPVFARGAGACSP